MIVMMVMREWLSSCPRRVVVGAGCDSYDGDERMVVFMPTTCGDGCWM